MTSYRRNFVAGGTFFFTVNLADRRLELLIEHIDALRAAFRETRENHPFMIEAMVVLPDHLHAVWAMPEGDADFATRWRLIKSAFSRNVPVGEAISVSRATAVAPDAKAPPGIGRRFDSIVQRSLISTLPQDCDNFNSGSSDRCGRVCEAKAARPGWSSAARHGRRCGTAPRSCR
jgi:REP element-mobilizing transposase RayT